jgi:hypothetical protein
MADFQRSILTGELLEVPGIGPAAKKKLMEAENEDDRITNTFQLLGKVSLTFNLYHAVWYGL